MNFIKKLWLKIPKRLRRWYVVVPAILILLGIVGAVIHFTRGSDQPLQTVTASRGTVREEVSVVGRVQPTERLDLSLQGSGRVAYVGAVEGQRVKRGQTLVSLSSDDLAAQLESALAGLQREQLTLDKLVAGDRPEDVAVTQTAADNARRALEAQVQESFSSVDSALGSKVDQFFDDPRTDTPEFGVAITVGTTRFSINASGQDKIRLGDEQAEMTRRMETLRDALATGSLDAQTAAADQAFSYAQTYLSDLAAVVNAYRPESSSQQALYDGLKADVSSARSSASSAASAVASAENSYRSAQANLDLKIAPADQNDVAIQQASVRAAQAQVALVRANIAKNAVISPVDGVLTEISAKVGESASPSAPVATVMADAKLEIEARVPEADIAKVGVDNEARVTLDAYPGATFQARVIYIAPAETMVEGVATYKVKLQFAEEDARLKPGMTADLDIATETHENVITIPQRAITTRGGKRYVKVPDGEGTKEIEVATGIRGVDGMTEIVSGLEEGQVVVTGNAASE